MTRKGPPTPGCPPSMVWMVSTWRPAKLFYILDKSHTHCRRVPLVQNKTRMTDALNAQHKNTNAVCTSALEGLPKRDEL